jgi:hypothetical protein
LLRSIRFWAGLGISIIFVILFLRATHPRTLASALQEANYLYLVPATFVLFGAVAIRCMRWSWLMRPVAPLTPSQLLPYAIIGYMANNLLPARAGEVVRAWVVGEREGVSKVAVLGTIAVERLFDGCVLVIMLLMAGAVVGIEDGRLKLIALASSLLFVAAFGGFYLLTHTEERARRVLGRAARLLPKRFEAGAEALAENLATSLRSVHHWRSLAVVALLSAAAWTVEAGCFAVLGRGFGLDLGFAHYALVLAAANLAIIVPTFFGGTGPFEWAAKLVLLGAGASDAIAGAFSVVAHGVILIPTTVLGLILLWSFGISFGRITHAQVAEDEPA